MCAAALAPQTSVTSQGQNRLKPTFAAAFRLTEQDPNQFSLSEEDLSPRRPKTPKITMHGYNASTDPPPAMYVRALYTYEADDHTSLSFKQGDVIQVLTQLESGWWDGVINDVRGWFPSNYCTIINDPDDLGDPSPRGLDRDTDGESGAEDELEDENDEDADSDGNAPEGNTSFPIEGTGAQEPEEAAYWIPQATPDGRLFYFNTLTGLSTMELPLETPTSINESGPQDRTNFHVPQQTRPPPEMLAQGFGRDEDDDDASGSDAEGESLMLASHGSSTRQRRSMVSDGVSPATSLDSLNTSPDAKLRGYYNNGSMSAITQAAHSMGPSGTSSTSFSVNPPMPFASSTAPRYFYDDGTTIPVTWNRLVENLCMSIGSFRRTVKSGERAELVRKAEDISDHLRMLLAAGSGTTDNHSGNPSIISTNKALYPHFRDMMSRFSKLVLSSHMAAADWPAPDSASKCIQEADGVLNGVYKYVDVARHQGGETIPRLVPGFVMGVLGGGNWQNNKMVARDPMNSTSFMDQDDPESSTEPNAILDRHLLTRIEDARKILQMTIRRLEEELVSPGKTVSLSRQIALGDSVCQAARMVLDRFSPWIAIIESVNLAPLGSPFQNPQLVDFTAQKQKVYDDVAELVTSCQAIAAPLADEWAELRGDYLEDRLRIARSVAGQLENGITRIGFSLQLFMEAMPGKGVSSPIKGEHRITDGGETYQQVHRDQLQAMSTRPQLGDMGQSQSYTVGMDMPPERLRRPNNTDKIRRIFGQMPPTEADETPWFLRLDHEGEVTFDQKVDPPQIKHGTLTGLVEQLTRHDRLDSLYNGTFLLTYRSFTTATELFEMLVQRFSVQPPYGLAKEDYSTWEDKKQKPIRFRVVNILKNWFENFWMESDDEVSTKLLQRVYAFAKDSVATTKTPGSGPLMAVVEQRLKKDTMAKRLVLTMANSAPASITPKNLKKLKFLDIDALEFARQLTIIESRLYGKIKPTECLNKTWQKKVSAEERDPAPNVKALILHSNQLTNWVAELILSQSDVKKRVIVIKHFVAIADKARSLNNFSTLTSIVSALGTSPILRLTRTWAQVNNKTTAVLESMRNLISSTRNFGEYREKLHLANPPCIPFFGVYLTDLTFIEDGIASKVKNSDLINFGKRAKTADVIRDIQQYQNVPYSLNSVNELQEYILGNMQAAGDVHDMYDKSVEVEPREREEEKITRYAGRDVNFFDARGLSLVAAGM